jgi:hypothetical protein
MSNRLPLIVIDGIAGTSEDLLRLNRADNTPWQYIKFSDCQYEWAKERSDESDGILAFHGRRFPA